MIRVIKEFGDTLGKLIASLLYFVGGEFEIGNTLNGSTSNYASGLSQNPIGHKIANSMSHTKPASN